LNHDLEQLKKHVIGFDNDGSFEMVTRLERRLEQAIAGEQLSQHVCIVEFRKGLELEIDAIDHLLKTQYPKDLSDRERQYLLDKKGLYERFKDAFGGQAQVKSIEHTIKQFLDHVRNQN
jgi:hypothetical protein